MDNLGRDMSKNSKELFELEELAMQPGTYFNPQTEVAMVVDDSVAIDPEVFADGSEDDSDWIRVSDEAPIDEQRRDELFEQFQKRREPQETDEDFDEVDEIEPDPLEDDGAEA